MSFQEKSMIPFGFEAGGPMPFMPHPNLPKMRAVIFHLLDAGPLLEADIHATVFLASTHHFRRHGRPVVGDTWVRGYGTYGVFGIVLSAILGDMKHRSIIGTKRLVDGTYSNTLFRLPSEKAADEVVGRLSPSDIEHLTDYRVNELKGHQREMTKGSIQAQALYGSGPAGSLIDWAAGLSQANQNDPETRKEAIFLLAQSR